MVDLVDHHGLLPEIVSDPHGVLLEIVSNALDIHDFAIPIIVTLNSDTFAGRDDAADFGRERDHIPGNRHNENVPDGKDESAEKHREHGAGLCAWAPRHFNTFLIFIKHRI